jgi:GMP synthase (glutamine-hydrolysing)
MRRILVLQHVAHESLGTLNPLLKQAGFRIRYVNFGRDPGAEPRLEGYEGLIVLGGPMNVDQIDRHPHLRTEVELVERALDRDIPVLGICLGAQLIARALGASVGPAGQKEIGWYDVSLREPGREDALLSNFDQTERIFQWHGDTFDIPRGAEHLASSELCPNQAFRYGDKVYGLQFHLEVDPGMIDRWLDLPANREEMEASAGIADPEEIRRESAQHIERIRGLADRTFGRWIETFGRQRPGRILASR